MTDKQLFTILANIWMAAWFLNSETQTVLFFLITLFWLVMQFFSRKLEAGNESQR